MLILFVLDFISRITHAVLVTRNLHSCNGSVTPHLRARSSTSRQQRSKAVTAGLRSPSAGLFAPKAG